MHIRTSFTKRMQNLRSLISSIFVRSYDRKSLPHVVWSPIQVDKAITTPSFRRWQIYLQGNVAKLIEIRVLQSNSRSNGLAQLTAPVGIFPHQPNSFEMVKSYDDVAVVLPEVFQTGGTCCTGSEVLGGTNWHFDSSSNKATISDVKSIHKGMLFVSSD
jgi:hypothetical protein